MSKAVREFQAVTKKIERLRSSRLVKNYEATMSGGCPSSPAQNRREREAYERLEELESYTGDIYEAATEDERKQMHKIDDMFLLMDYPI